jgi:pimeloyl-ACP methyl ester carboxylesterase
LAGSEYMTSKIPNAVKRVIPNAGHASNMDQPQLFNEAVLGFLAGLNLQPA